MPLAADLKDIVTEISEDVFLIRQPWESAATGIVVLVGDTIGVVDTGLRTAAESYIYPFIKRLGRDIEDISTVVNTHCHFDHIGSNSILQDRTGAEIAAHEADAKWIEDLNLQWEDIWARFHEEQSLPADLEEAAAPSLVTRRLHGGERIRLGAREFEVIHFPGHSPGSICLYEEAGGMVISGDSIQGQGSKPAGMPMVMDLTGYASALQKMASRKIRCLILGHEFLPYEKSMILEGREAMNLVAESARTISRYIIETGKFLENCENGASLVHVRDHLAERFGGGRKSIQGMFTAEAVISTLTERGFAVKDDLSDVWRAP